MKTMLSRWRAIGGGVALVVFAAMPPTAAHDKDKADPRHTHPTGPEHIHAAVPADYRQQAPSPTIWTDKMVIARGAAIHAAKCAVCHGNHGRGDGPAVAGLIMKPASFGDKAMVAEMT